MLVKKKLKWQIENSKKNNARNARKLFFQVGKYLKNTTWAVNIKRYENMK